MPDSTFMEKSKIVGINYWNISTTVVTWATIRLVLTLLIIHKWHGRKQTFGVNFFETLAFIVTWASIRLVLIQSTNHTWFTRHIDFVLTYPQAIVASDSYLQVVTGYHVKEDSASDYTLKPMNNVDGHKQAKGV